MSFHHLCSDEIRSSITPKTFMNSDTMPRAVRHHAKKMTVLLKRALSVLPNLSSFAIEGLSEYDDPDQPYEILDSLRLQPDLRTFYISVPSIHEPTLFSFLKSHQNLKDISLKVDDYGILSDSDWALGLPELHLPHLERFEAPFMYWHAIHPTPTLTHASIYQDPFYDMEDDLLDILAPLQLYQNLSSGNGHGLTSVEIHVPASEVSQYILHLKDIFPDLEHLTLIFEHWLDHGTERVRLPLSSLGLRVDSIVSHHYAGSLYRCH